MEFNSLKDVLQEQLEDLHSAETQLIAALPKMAQAAHHDQLREAFETHLEETKGLITEGEEMIETAGDPNVKDVALIAAAQRVEHYEIAAYGTARQLADDCGFDAIKDLMDQTLDEESQADKL